MELLKAVVLGVIQGFTEFLPISSSGHLVIGSEIMNFHEQGIAFDVFLHLGTLVSVTIVFRREILAMIKAPLQYFSGDRSAEVMQNLGWDFYVVIATIPAVFAGLYLKDSIQNIFSSLNIVFFMLFITGILMIGTRYLKFRDVSLHGKHAFIIGCAQALAIFPGLSRSGSTIFAGMALGIERQVVARFSFIMSIPVILGAVILQLGDLISDPPDMDSCLNIAAGTLMAGISGYYAIVLLLDIINKNRLQWFGYYCLALSVTGLVYTQMIAS
jgi:undecaprenyl-diphosphatase